LEKKLATKKPRHKEKLDRITGFFHHEGTKGTKMIRNKGTEGQRHKADFLGTKCTKMNKKGLYKHINSWIPAPQSGRGKLMHAGTRAGGGRSQ